MSKVEQLFEQAMKLKKKDRVELATRLRDAVIPDPLDDEISQEEWERIWGEEIVRRAERYDRGETKARDAFEALGDARKRLAQGRKK